MKSEAFTTSEGIYNTCYNVAGLAFQTPEALMRDSRFRSVSWTHLSRCSWTSDVSSADTCAPWVYGPFKRQWNYPVHNRAAPQPLLRSSELIIDLFSLSPSLFQTENGDLWYFLYPTELFLINQTILLSPIPLRPKLSLLTHGNSESWCLHVSISKTHRQTLGWNSRAYSFHLSLLNYLTLTSYHCVLFSLCESNKYSDILLQ